ncbi:hypothetical protein JXA56_03320 [Candidatus Micrarchaeota archaeon]|nr:hypothetical protein [Candidatus Micrarchaeota archaeon]
MKRSYIVFVRLHRSLAEKIPKSDNCPGAGLADGWMRISTAEIIEHATRRGVAGAGIQDREKRGPD